MKPFTLYGDYRVQSRLDYALSMLQGNGMQAPTLISNRSINRVLRKHPLWVGHTRVTLLPAKISLRSGKFASEPDILYKRDLFIPRMGTTPMTEDIVDVLKSKQNWSGRRCHLPVLFGAALPELLRPLGELELIIANEYMLHEAGHFIGYDVYAKQRDGYFRQGGHTAWPLIYLEELRADLNSFGFALQLMSSQRAVAIFLYNLLLRFGVHRQGWVRQQSAPYGLVPYLLYCLLMRTGFLQVAEEHGHAHFVLCQGTDTPQLIAAMRMCAMHAEQQLNCPELAGGTVLDHALRAAEYVRNQLDNKTWQQAFSAVMQQPATETENHEPADTQPVSTPRQFADTAG